MVLDGHTLQCRLLHYTILLMDYVIAICSIEDYSTNSVIIMILIIDHFNNCTRFITQWAIIRMSVIYVIPGHTSCVDYCLTNYPALFTSCTVTMVPLQDWHGIVYCLTSAL